MFRRLPSWTNFVGFGRCLWANSIYDGKIRVGFRNDGKFETPGKTGKTDQRKKWSHKEPWPDAFSEDTYH
ncbi:hypothetical protein evm_008553 [Chilo suppressalis]|nr:hypothetical protein evm_008553 [Chilo suppressalis]